MTSTFFRKQALFFFILFSLVSLTTNSQPLKMKNVVSQVFFDIDLPITRFDLREKLNKSNNFKGYYENNESFNDQDVIGVKFNENSTLEFTQNSINKSIEVSFSKGKDISESLNMNLWFKIQDVDYSRKQLNAIIKKFKSISYKIVKNTKYEDNDSTKKKVGEVIYIYSSLSSFNKGKSCIDLIYYFTKINNPVKNNVSYEIPSGEYYTIDMIVFPDKIK